MINQRPQRGEDTNGDSALRPVKRKSRPTRHRNNEEGSSGKEVASGEAGDESEARDNAKARKKLPSKNLANQQYNLRKSEKARGDKLGNEPPTGQEASVAPSA